MSISACAKDASASSTCKRHVLGIARSGKRGGNSGEEDARPMGSIATTATAEVMAGGGLARAPPLVSSEPTGVSTRRFVVFSSAGRTRARPRARPQDPSAGGAGARARDRARMASPETPRGERADALEVRRGAVIGVACFREGRETREAATRERSTARGDARRGGARSASAARAGRALKTRARRAARLRVSRATRARLRARGERHETASDSRRSAKPFRWFQTERKRGPSIEKENQTARRSIERRSRTGRKYGGISPKHGRGDERKERKNRRRPLPPTGSVSRATGTVCYHTLNEPRTPSIRSMPPEHPPHTTIDTCDKRRRRRLDDADLVGDARACQTAAARTPSWRRRGG